ncbi:MAG: CocE/NonD family hydrolase [Actinomycetota bacterium]|nr:CocE/NonD family hydrolase [Actinomycetota bacterium]
MRLFARAVLPDESDRTPTPAILEYLPYRLTDGTSFGDALHHPYFAAHGYASVRVDMRGTGNSDGILLDEYLPQEQLDGCEVIAWIARQPWCSGNVGIFGKSWGGFNGLQIAARRPPALKAVISVYSTDDRYADDVHYMGGCLLAHDALSWASLMLGINALPPDPAVVGERWREMWLRRLQETPFFADTWLRHQRRDDFWRQGSICEDFAALRSPVLLVGGWADGYTNAVDRMLTGLTAAGVPCRGLIGPWSHGWPEVADPGPRIGFLQECVKWWDHWLKGESNGVMDGPLLRAWIQDYVQPASFYSIRPGRWVGEDQWPSARVESQSMFGSADGELSPEPGSRALVEHRGNERSGSDAGVWCPYGHPGDLPTDQRAEDGLALCFSSGPLSDPLEILGRPVAVLELTADRPRALVAVRLCDVAPDGSSLLVSRGLLNLTHREGHAEPLPIVPGQPMVVEVPLDLAGHRFAAGHRIRLAIACTYWPFVWPSPEPVTLGVLLGERTGVRLPVRRVDQREQAPEVLDLPEHGAAPEGNVRADYWRRVLSDAASGQLEHEVGAAEDSTLARTGLRFGERAATRFSIRESQPVSAQVDYSGEHYLERADWRIRILARTSLSGSQDELLLTMDLDAYENGVRVHGTRHSASIPREGI